MHFYNSFIMHYNEYFTLRDCSGLLQIRSHIIEMYDFEVALLYTCQYGSSQKLCSFGLKSHVIQQYLSFMKVLEVCGDCI